MLEECAGCKDLYCTVNINMSCEKCGLTSCYCWNNTEHCPLGPIRMICCVHKHTDYMKAYSAYILKNVSNTNICLRFFSTFRYFDDEIQLILTNLADSWKLSDIKIFKYHK